MSLLPHQEILIKGDSPRARALALALRARDLTGVTLMDHRHLIPSIMKGTLDWLGLETHFIELAVIPFSPTIDSKILVLEVVEPSKKNPPILSPNQVLVPWDVKERHYGHLTVKSADPLRFGNVEIARFVRDCQIDVNIPKARPLSVLKKRSWKRWPDVVSDVLW